MNNTCAPLTIKRSPSQSLSTVIGGVWPDWTILKGLDYKFSFKSSPNIWRLFEPIWKMLLLRRYKPLWLLSGQLFMRLLGQYETNHLLRKKLLWLSLGNFCKTWATFYFNFWSRWASILSTKMSFEHSSFPALLLCQKILTFPSNLSLQVIH